MFSGRAVDEATHGLAKDRFRKRNEARKDPAWNDRNKPCEVRQRRVVLMKARCNVPGSRSARLRATEPTRSPSRAHRRFPMSTQSSVIFYQSVLHLDTLMSITDLTTSRYIPPTSQTDLLEITFSQANHLGSPSRRQTAVPKPPRNTTLFAAVIVEPYALD